MSSAWKIGLPSNVTVVSNQFIDEYMAAANGEYVKVFLYLLRHEGEPVQVSSIADALNHTESDISRALSYWNRLGVLEKTEQREEEFLALGTEEGEMAREGAGSPGSPSAPESGETYDRSMKKSQDALVETLATAQEMEPVPQPGDSYERMKRLADDEEFSALLYAVQQYLGKTFTQIECEKFAFFYDGLHMSGELLEYLAEYCAGGGHFSIRYIEKVAISWYQAGIRTREEAREYTARFSRDVSSVMKAFGISGRNPAAAEQDFMRRWFKEYGFDGALAAEACNRTITATGAVSFPYADKILEEWYKNGVKTLRDVELLDKKHQEKKTAGRDTARKRSAGSVNRFKNFEERSYDYENYVWENVRKRQRKEGKADGSK